MIVFGGEELAVKIRLARHGAKKAPFYRLVVADERAPRNGRFIEVVGRYNPRTNPSTINLDIEKIDEWLAKGAQPTEAAAKLIAAAKGGKEAPVAEAKPSKKAQAKAEAEAKAAAEAEAAAKAEAEAKAAAEAEAAAEAAEAKEAEEAAEEPAEAKAEEEPEA